MTSNPQVVNVMRTITERLYSCRLCNGKLMCKAGPNSFSALICVPIYDWFNSVVEWPENLNVREAHVRQMRLAFKSRSG